MFEKKIVHEILVDLLSSPYALSSATLYLNSGENFIAYFRGTETNRFDNPASIVNGVAMLALLISYFCTFSQTNSKFFGLSIDSRWGLIKSKIRSCLKIPSPLIKTFIGSTSVFLSTQRTLGIIGAGILTGISGATSLFSQYSLYGSEHTASEDTNETTRSKIIKYSLVHSSTAGFSFSNSAIYYNSLTNLPKKFGLFSNSLGENNGLEDKVLYGLVWIVVIFNFLSVHLSYAHLNENTCGLIKTENPKWTAFKNKTKKPFGVITAGTKSFTAGCENFLFFSPYFNKGVNIATSSIAGISGLITQLSILYGDPITKENSNSIVKENSQTTEDENAPLIPKPKKDTRFVEESSQITTILTL